MSTTSDDSEEGTSSASEDAREDLVMNFPDEGNCTENLLCSLPAEIILNVWRILTHSTDGDRHFDSRVAARDKEKGRRASFMSYLPQNLVRFPHLKLIPPYKEIPLHYDTALRSCSKHVQSVCDTARTSIFFRVKMQASAEPYMRRLPNLKAASIQYSQGDDVCSSLSAFHRIQPALDTLLLHAAGYYTLKVDLNSMHMSWGSTLQQLELHNMTCVTGSKSKGLGLSFLSHLSTLKELRLHHVSPFLKTADIAGCSSLQKLTVHGGHLPFDASMKAKTVLDLSSLTSLHELTCERYSLTQLSVAGLTVLQRLVCSQNRLERLDLSTCIALQQLSCSKNSLLELDMAHNPELRILDCSGNPLSKLQLSSCTLLQDLKCGAHDCSITELDLDAFTCLETLELSGIPISTLHVQALSNLVTFKVYGCERLLSVDLSGLKSLRHVSVENPGTAYTKPSALSSLWMSRAAQHCVNWDAHTALRLELSVHQDAAHCGSWISGAVTCAPLTSQGA